MVDADLTLLAHWCAGDALAGNRLFKRHFKTVYRFLEHKIASPSEIDDLVQATFHRCVEMRDRFKRQCSFRTFLFAIARNVLLEYWRAKTISGRGTNVEEASLEALTTSIGTRLDRRADRARLISVLQSMPLDQQTLLEMFYWEDLDRDQLAVIFDVEPATVGSRLTRARKALRDRLAQIEGSLVSDDADLDVWARSVVSGRVR